MPFNTEIHASVGYVSKKHKALLEKLSGAYKRKLKDELEYLIEQAAKAEGLL